MMVALVFFGYLCFRQLGISEFPDVDFPVVSIDLNWEGASPELNETQVVDVIEGAIASVQGIKGTYSVSKTQGASVTAEFELGTDIDVAVQDIQAAVARAQRSLPKNMDPPIISKTNPEDRPIIYITLASNVFSREELMAMVRDKIKGQFSTISGVADIQLAGFIDPNLLVDVNPVALNKLYLSSTDILTAISQEHVELPAGHLEAKTFEKNARTYGEARTLAEFRELPLLKRGGALNFTTLTLGQVASINFGLANNRSIARVNQTPCVGLGFKKQRGSNAVEVGDAIKARMKELQGQYGSDIRFAIAFDSTTYIADAIHETMFTLIFSAILTSLVCWLFLGSLGATINVVLAIPTAILGTFVALSYFGFTLNTFTLLGLSLAIGIIVDDAIMILENITRHQEMGKDKMTAAIEGTQEIFMAVVATSASLIAIFLPVIFVKGIIGAYLFEFGLTLSVAVALSMVEALTLTPMRCARMLGTHHKTNWLTAALDTGMQALAKGYKRGLAGVLKHPFITLALAVVLFAASTQLTQFLPQEFMPYQDTGRISLVMRAPLGVSIDIMDKRLAKVEAVLAKTPGMETYLGAIGGTDVNAGRGFIQLKNKNERPINPQTGKRYTQREIADELRAKFKTIKGIKVLVKDNSNRGFMERKGFPVEVSVKGPEWKTLAASAEKLQAKMAASGLMTDVDSDYLEGLPEIQIIPNREQAEKMGVNVSEINKVIQTMIGGAVAGQFTKGTTRLDIRVRLQDGFRNTPEDINNLYVRNNRGELVSIGKVVTLKEKKILQQITRENRERAITLSANIAPGKSQAAALAEVQRLAKATLPKGYYAQFSGSSESFNDSFGGILLAMGLGLCVAYMVLASQFNSFLYPFIIFFALPFSISGVFVALLMNNQSLNIFSLIGIMLVLGIVLKNGILLVDFTNQKRESGLSVSDALLEACPLRLRPILMTSLATITGALPAALALGPGAESRVPMALSVIGGVTVSTLLTLFVVPCVYRILTFKKP